MALPGNRILIGTKQFGVGAEIQDHADGRIERLLALMDGTRTVEEIIDEFTAAFPSMDRQSVGDVINSVIDGGFAEEADAPLPANLTVEEAARYRTARDFFSWIDLVPRESPYAVQSAIKEAEIALLGVGGTGSAVASGLVAGGVGALHLADYDLIEESNLTRQLLYSESDIGRSKVDTAVASLSSMNRLVEVTGSDVKATGPDDIAELMTGRDVFVLCADKPFPDIMRWTNVAALRTGTPWFFSLYAGPMAVVGSFHPGETGCWTCLDRSEAQREHKRDGRSLMREDQPNAVVAASANIGGHLCALDVLYHLGGLPRQTRGQVFHWNYARWDHSYAIEVPFDADCPDCGSAR
ncbi:ThiF family adenylyltransferase [Nonomuraea sp. B10E15]|uniref:HesA/MoeB/ThiF family protein n=1 Tax=unclassified Nonomuraea TaxID=2593643 RepID=UPI00325D9C9A